MKNDFLEVTEAARGQSINRTLITMHIPAFENEDLIPLALYVGRQRNWCVCKRTGSCLEGCSPCLRLTVSHWLRSCIVPLAGGEWLLVYFFNCFSDIWPAAKMLLVAIGALLTRPLSIWRTALLRHDC